MKMGVRKLATIVTILLAVILWLVSMVIVKKDTDFSCRWVALAFHYSSFFPILTTFIYEQLEDKSWKVVFKKENILQFLFILLLAAISYFIFLEKYPFVSVGDELRDNGLLALQINKGRERNIFGYGAYNGYGLDVSVIAGFFYRLFGSSVLTYRFPSALLAVVEVVIIYLLGYLILGKTMAFWLAVSLIALPLQLMLARTEFLVLFNSFLTTATLFLFFFLEDEKVINFAIFGIILGFSFGFHTAARVVALIILGIVILLEFFSVSRLNIKKKGLNLLILILFCFIGFGPRLLFTKKDVFFAKDHFYTQFNEQQNFIDKFNKFGERYYHSFLSWMVEPLQNRTVDNQPILTPFLGAFFVVGLVTSLLFWNNLYLKIISFLALALPFSNSALTDTLNQGHRLSVLLPIGAVLVAVGIIVFQQRMTQKIIRNIFSFFVLVYLLSQIFFFFYHQPISKSAGLKDYLSMHLIYFLKNHPELASRKICLRVSPTNWQNLDLLHYKEQYAYFFPDLDIERFADSGVNDDEIFIGTNDNCEQQYLFLPGGEKVLSSANNSYNISCADQKAFICPLGYSGEIKIHY